MSLTFFWRCEGTTLDGTDDFSAGDTTAAANNTPSISATAAKVGSNGILIDSSADGYRFSPTSIINRLTGAIAFWFQFPVTFPATGQVFFFARGSASANDNISIGVGTGSDELRLGIRSATLGGVDIDTSGANLTAGNWYFVTASWDQPNNDRRIAVYDVDGTLLGSAGEDTSTAFAAPDALDAGDGLRFGDATGWGASGNGWFDNIFIGDAYSDATDFHTNRNITSYTNYGGSGPTIMVMSDDVVLIDEEIDVLNRRRTFDESISLTETLSRILNRQRTVSDTLTVFDAEGRVLEVVFLDSDVIDVTDGLVKTVTGAGTVYSRVVGDNLVLIDEVGQRYLIKRATISDVVSIVEALTVIRSLRRTAGDDVIVADGTAVVRRYSRLAEDLLEIEEAVAGTYLPAVRYNVSRIVLSTNDSHDATLGGY